MLCFCVEMRNNLYSNSETFPKYVLATSGTFIVVRAHTHTYFAFLSDRIQRPSIAEIPPNLVSTGKQKFFQRSESLTSFLNGWLHSPHGCEAESCRDWLMDPHSLTDCVHAHLLGSLNKKHVLCEQRRCVMQRKGREKKKKVCEAGLWELWAQPAASESGSGPANILVWMHEPLSEPRWRQF